LSSKEHKFFNQNFSDIERFYRLAGPHLLTLIPDDQRSSLEEGDIFYSNDADIRRLANGPHLLRMYNEGGYHAMSLIKLSDSQYYVFDPDKGLFEFSGDFASEGIISFLNTEYRFSHKYIYFRFLRRMSAVCGDPSVQASDLKELYIQIVPMFSGRDLPVFGFVNLSRIAERDNNSMVRYPIGCLEYAWGCLVDSFKASSMSALFMSSK
jgi:hypothetical protein